MKSQMLSRCAVSENWHAARSRASREGQVDRVLAALFSARVLYGLPGNTGTTTAGRRGEVLRHPLRSLDTAAPVVEFVAFFR